jgi:hypothetical protein
MIAAFDRLLQDRQANRIDASCRSPTNVATTSLRATAAVHDASTPSITMNWLVAQVDLTIIASSWRLPCITRINRFGVIRQPA